MPVVESGVALRLNWERILDISWIFFILVSFYFFSHRYFQKLKYECWRYKESVCLIPMNIVLFNHDISQIIEDDLINF